MIVVRICGGLGNQLFQYAAGRRLAIEYQTELLLDLEWFRSTPASNTLRAFELSQYPIAAQPVVGLDERWCRFHGGRLTGRLGISWGGWRLFRERSFDFDETVITIGDNTYLSGYWQSFRYFEEISDLIRTELTPTIPPTANDDQLLKIMSSTNSVSVHVRRGDYISQKAAAAVHGSCSPEYYDAALKLLCSQMPDPVFFIFSDDVNWVKNNMKFPGQTIFVEHNDSASAFQDLRLMATCKHHIIANSSFSWWGAWLNRNEDKCVIAPAKWFADHRKTPTLMPNSWLRI
jgi:hypothetical protein